jgi:recombination associated protein RdgC
MLFRNLSLFRFPAGKPGYLDELETRLESRRLRACGPMDLATRGFVSPYGRDEEDLVHRSGRSALVTIGAEDKLLPGVVVRETLAERLAALAAKDGRRIGARERQRMKDEVIAELLPRAFSRPSRRHAWLEERAGWLAVDTASRKAAEESVSELREALGRFPATPPAPQESPRALMTDWLIRGNLPAGLALGDECELRDPADTGASVRCRRQELESDEVREHLKSGKQVFQLGLEFDGRIHFVLAEDLTVRKLRFADVVLDGIEQRDLDSTRAEVGAQFAPVHLELERLLQQLETWFGWSRPGKGD